MSRFADNLRKFAPYMRKFAVYSCKFAVYFRKVAGEERGAREFIRRSSGPGSG